MNTATTLSNIGTSRVSRVHSGLSELDKVLGGGFAIGSGYLLSGDPGVGKSTLLMQAALSLSERHKTLYVSGEETDDQIANRAKRLGFIDGNDNLYILASNNWEVVLEQLNAVKPEVLIIDSVQTISSNAINGLVGNPNQVKGVAQNITAHCKANKIIHIIIAQITKAANIAGPKAVEHLVDCVLYASLDGQKRALQASKNRLGTTNVVGYFDMTDKGLVPSQPPKISQANPLLEKIMGEGFGIVKKSLSKALDKLIQDNLPKRKKRK